MGSGFLSRTVLAILLGLATAWLLAPLFLPRPQPPLPVWAWAPGYWEISPRLGIARVIPLAPYALVNPAASAAPTDLSAPAGSGKN